MTTILPSSVAVIGAGGHAKVVVSTVRALGGKVSALYDDDRARWGSEVAGVPVRGPIGAAAEEGCREAVLAIGDNRARSRLARDPALAGLAWRTVVHPAAWIDPSVELGAGTVVFAGAVIQPDSTLGEHVIVNTGASIDHDCRVGDFVHVAPGSRLAGNVTVGEGTLFGLASAAIPGVSIGAWTTVGAGAVVVRNLPDRVVAIGCPARVAPDGGDRG